MAFLRGAVAEPFAGPVVELLGDPIAVGLREPGHALFLGEVLANEPEGSRWVVSLARPMNVRHLSAWQEKAPQLMGRVAFTRCYGRPRRI